MKETTATQSPVQERLEACQELVAERPYSHPVATGWYAEDVPNLLAVAKAARDVLHLEYPRGGEEQMPATGMDGPGKWKRLRRALEQVA